MGYFNRLGGPSRDFNSEAVANLAFADEIINAVECLLRTQDGVHVSLNLLEEHTLFRGKRINGKELLNEITSYKHIRYE